MPASSKKSKSRRLSSDFPESCVADSLGAMKDDIIHQAKLTLPNGRTMKLDVVSRVDLERLSGMLGAGGSGAAERPVAGKAALVPKAKRPLVQTPLSGDPNESLTVQQVAEILNCSIESVYDLRSRNLVASTKMPEVGVRFLRGDIEDYVAKHTRHPVRTSRASKSRTRGRSSSRDQEEVVPGITREELKRRVGF